jgi:hypothetical protein
MPRLSVQQSAEIKIFQGTPTDPIIISPSYIYERHKTKHRNNLTKGVFDFYLTTGKVVETSNSDSEL